MSLKTWNLESVSIRPGTVFGNVEEEKYLTDKQAECNSETTKSNLAHTKKTSLRIKPTEERKVRMREEKYS